MNQKLIVMVSRKINIIRIGLRTNRNMKDVLFNKWPGGTR